MRNVKKLLSILLMLTMLVSLFGLTASAVDSDPYLTSGGDFTYVVDWASIPEGGTTVPLYAVPADSSFNPTYFDTIDGAEDVVWSRAAGSEYGTSMGAVTVAEIGDEEYASCLTVNISYDAIPGPSSFHAERDGGGYVDITVVVTNTALNDWEYRYTGLVKCQIYDPSDDTLYAGNALTINAENHTDGRSYVTVLDALVEMEDIPALMIGGFVESYGYVSSITVKGVPYAASGMDGWQYRVYDRIGLTNQYEIVPVSEILGAGDMDMRVFDLVQWRYGSYYDENLFPETVTA